MKAQRKPIIIDRARVDYDADPRTVLIEGRMRIDGSPQGNFRPVQATLTLEEAEHLHYYLGVSISGAKTPRVE